MKKKKKICLKKSSHIRVPTLRLGKTQSRANLLAWLGPKIKNSYQSLYKGSSNMKHL